MNATLQFRKSEDRGYASHGWLKSHHTFSFADYYDSKHMGFRALRVINEDRIDGGTGFGAHPHRDMEIISYVVKGALQHQDSMGTRALIKPGEVQRMSAGTGVVHSEKNALENEETHFFQIWILPKKNGTKPGYGQKSFAEDLARKDLVLVASEDGREGSLGIQQDVDMYLSRLASGATMNFALRPGRGAWVQIVRGSVQLNGETLRGGDAVAVEAGAPGGGAGGAAGGVGGALALNFSASEDSELMLFDLA